MQKVSIESSYFSVCLFFLLDLIKDMWPKQDGCLLQQCLVHTGFYLKHTCKVVPLFEYERVCDPVWWSLEICNSTSGKIRSGD